MRPTRFIARLLCGGLLCLPGALVHAQDWPARELNFYVNYGAGSSTDLSARIQATEMSKVLGQPIVVQNKPGAQGTLGPALVARQKADGYSFGILSYAPAAIAPHLTKVNYTLDDFDVIAGTGRYRYGVAVRADSPYKTIQDLVDASKKGNGLFFSATGAPNNLALLRLGMVSGGKFEFIPFKSGPDAVTALLGSQVEAVVQTPSDIMPHVQAGKLRLLASVSPVRWPEQPDTPTIKEAGFDVEIDSWTGIAAPRGLPADVRKRLEGAALQAVRAPAYQEKMNQLGVEPAGLGAEEYRAMLERGYKEMGTALQAAGLIPNH